jgi:hypothetical protein
VIARATAIHRTFKPPITHPIGGKRNLKKFPGVRIANTCA